MYNRGMKKRGFTIIEVVLVLAIAGLIFLMVFIALPALQRSQRDTQREEDLSRAVTALTRFKANNRNRIPVFEGTGTTWAAFKEQYLNVNGQDLFEDPLGEPYSFASSGGTADLPSTTPGDGVITVYTGYRCDGETLVPSAGRNQVAFVLPLEGGGFRCNAT